LGLRRGRGRLSKRWRCARRRAIQPQDSLIAETTPEGIFLRPVVTLPVEIYGAKRVAEFDDSEAELAAVPGGRGGK